MPHGSVAPAPVTAPVHDDIAFRVWLATEVATIKTTLKALPCKEREAELRQLRSNGDTARGQRTLLLKIAPWILAGLGIGYAGKGALDAPAPTPAATPPPITAR